MQYYPLLEHFAFVETSARGVTLRLIREFSTK